MKMNEIYAIPGYPIIDACACARLNPLKRRGGKQTILISVTLDVQTFASRKFRECQNSGIRNKICIVATFRNMLFHYQATNLIEVNI